MEYEFKEKSSRVHDFLYFPRLVYVSEQYESISRENDLMKEVASEDYIRFTEEIQKKLAAFKQTIANYYHNDIYADFDFIQILSLAVPINKYEDERNYLNDLSAMDDKSLKKRLKAAIIEIDEDVMKSDETDQVVETESKNEDFVSFINDLSIDSGLKWNLLMMIQNTKTYVSDYVAFMEKMVPMFSKVYEKHARDVGHIGEALIERLNNDPQNSLGEITHDIVDEDIIKTNRVIVFVSALFPYSMRIFSIDDLTTFVWGKKMEESFEIIAKRHEDKRLRRAEIFKALGDKTRYEVLRLLAQGVTSTKDIAAELDVSSATISYHLNEFLTTGVISLGKKGRKSGYRIDYDLLRDVLEEFMNDLKPEKE